MEYLSMFVAISIAVIIHEFAHALVMRAYGVEIKKFGIGVPLIPITLFTFRIGKMPIFVHPLLIGAYVEPTERGEEYMQRLSMGKRMDIYAAGVLANIFLVACIVGVIFWDNEIRAVAIRFPVAIIVVCGVLLLLRRVFSFLMPFLGLAGLWWLMQIITSTPDALMGPVGMVSQPSASGSSIWERIGTLSFSLALFNMIPIPPMDGGRAAMVLLERIFGKHDALQNAIMTIGITLLIVFFIWVTFGDVLRLFGE